MFFVCLHVIAYLPISILAEKLRMLKVPHNLVRLITNILIDRSVHVIVDNNKHIPILTKGLKGQP